MDEQRECIEDALSAPPLLVLKIAQRLWAISDQGLSSVTNFAFAVVAARALEVSEFGFYAVLAAIYWLVIGSSRAIVGETLLISEKIEIIDTADRSATPVATMFIGALGGAVVAGLAVVLPHRATDLLTLAIFLPVLAYQDGLRYLCFASRRYRTAFASDLSWLFVFLVVHLLLTSTDIQPTVSTIMLSWALGGLAACWIILPLGVVPWGLSAASDWLARTRSLGMKTWGEFLVGSGIAQVVIFGIPVFSSLYVAAELKAAQLSVAPWQVAVTAMSVLAIPYISKRERSRGSAAGLRACVALSGVAALAGAMYVAVLTLIPESWGEQLFGDVWSSASKVAPVFGAAATLIAMSQSVVYLMRSQGRSGRLLIARLVLAPITIFLALGGAVKFGASGAAWGLTLSAMATLTIWWGLAVHNYRRFEAQKAEMFSEATT